MIHHFSDVLGGVDWRVEAQEAVDAGEGCVLIRQQGSASARPRKSAATWTGSNSGS